MERKSKAKDYNSSRGTWFGVNPVTKVTKDKTKYDRKKEKSNWRKEVRNDE